MVRFNRNGSSEARAYDRQTRLRVGGLTIPSDLYFVGLEWASDETLLASVSTRLRFERSKIHLPTARIFSYDIKERRQPVLLFENESRILKTNVRLNKVVDLLPQDKDHIIMGAWRSGDFDLYRVNIETGDADRVAKGRGTTLAWFTNAEGDPSLRMDCATNLCRKIKLYSPEAGYDRADTRTDWKHLQSFEQNDDDSETFLKLQPIAPAENPDEFYVIDGRDDQPSRSIRLFNVRTNQFTSTIYADETHDVSGALIDPRTRQYMGAQIWRDRIDYDLVDDELQSHLDALNDYFEGPWNVSFQDIAKDQSAALIYASSSKEPGAFYLYDFETRDTRLIERVNHNLHNGLQTQTDIVKIKTRDGSELTAYVTVPEENGNNKLVMLIHGGPEQRDVLDYDRDAQFLATRGYTVARVNFRGSSGYGRAFARAGYHQWGSTMHTDIIDTTIQLQNQFSIDPSETCIMGHSYGAYAALLAGAHQPQLYNCIVAGSGPSDLNQFLKDERKDHGKNSPQMAYWEKSIGDRKADKSKLSAISPLNLVDRYDDPILLIHGTFDRIVSVDHSTELNEALTKAGKSVEFLELKAGHSHAFWSRKAQIDYLETLDAHLATSLAD